jgi:hypothetical protein
MQHTSNVGTVNSGLTLTYFDREVLIEQTGMTSICCVSETEAPVRVHGGPQDKPRITVKHSGEENSSSSCECEDHDFS